VEPICHIELCLLQATSLHTITSTVHSLTLILSAYLLNNVVGKRSDSSS